MNDLVIRGATVIDGLGNEPKRADVAIRDGRIVAVGADVRGTAAAVVDAGGLALCPGIVDVHTHYDAQVTWDRTLSPSSSLGVTTVVMGNCGFGIVPCPPPAPDTLMRNLSVVEGMNLDALRAGMRWNFESFADYMGFLRSESPYLNTAVLVGHSPIRTVVMGEDASRRKHPTPEELMQMRELVRGALRAGAIGFASSVSPNHSGYGGVPMPSTIAEDGELAALVGVLGEERTGVFQIASGVRATVEFLEGLGRDTGRPVFMSSGTTLYNEAAPTRAVAVLDQCAEARRRGAAVYSHVSCQPLSMEFTAADPYPLYAYAALASTRNVTTSEKRSIYGTAEFREDLRRQLRSPPAGAAFSGNWARVIVGVAATGANAKLEGASIADLAGERGCDPIDLFFDLSLEEDLHTVFVGRLYNAVDEGVLPILRHDSSVVALSDAGAHLTFLCDAGFGLYFLGHWVREKVDFDLADGVRRLTSQPADLYKICDRGRIAPGAWADLLLFDPDNVGISGSIRVNDLPGGASRTIREPRGVIGSWVNGTRVFEDGRLVRLQRGPGHVLDRFG